MAYVVGPGQHRRGGHVGLMLASRVLFSQGPAASSGDWWWLYLTISVVACLAAMAMSRSWRWGAAGGLLALLVVCVGGTDARTLTPV